MLTSHFVTRSALETTPVGSTDGDVALRIIVMFAYLCTVPIVISILRTVYVWWQDEKSGRIHLKEHTDVWTPEEIRKLEKRVEQLETEARTRSFSPSETIARWTAVSGNATLSQYQSEKDIWALKNVYKTGITCTAASIKLAFKFCQVSGCPLWLPHTERPPLHERLSVWMAMATRRARLSGCPPQRLQYPTEALTVKCSKRLSNPMSGLQPKWLPIWAAVHWEAIHWEAVHWALAGANTWYWLSTREAFRLRGCSIWLERVGAG